MGQEMSCASTTASVAPEKQEPSKPSEAEDFEGRKSKVSVFVGKTVPDFEAPAYLKGRFTKVKLSTLRGKWVLLCFYPGDFTFV